MCYSLIFTTLHVLLCLDLLWIVAWGYSALNTSVFDYLWAATNVHDTMPWNLLRRGFEPWAMKLHTELVLSSKQLVSQLLCFSKASFSLLGSLCPPRDGAYEHYKRTNLVNLLSTSQPCSPSSSGFSFLVFPITPWALWGYPQLLVPCLSHHG